jgi:hypothetical protein
MRTIEIRKKNPVSKMVFKRNKRDDARTPQWLFDDLNNLYYFDCDPCPFRSKVNGL